MIPPGQERVDGLGRENLPSEAGRQAGQVEVQEDFEVWRKDIEGKGF